MNTQVEINGIQLVPLKEAARRISYSRDYLAKLARDQKIIATQIGRQWFIDMSSLQSFLNSAMMEQEIRKQQLREERKRELLAKSELKKVSIDIEKNINKTRNLSLVVSMIVLSLGLLSGAFIYNVSIINNSLNNNLLIKDISASSFEAKNNELKNIEPQAVAVYSTVTEYPLFVDESIVREMRNSNQGVILFNEGVENGNPTTVENLFSDSTSVQFTDDNSGYVIYQNQDGSTKEIPFVSVPDNDF